MKDKKVLFQKRIFFRPLSISKQKTFVYWPNFQWRFWLSLPTPLGLERIFAINRWFKKCSSAVSWKIDAPFTSFKMATIRAFKMVNQVGSKRYFILLIFSWITQLLEVADFFLSVCRCILSSRKEYTKEQEQGNFFQKTNENKSTWGFIVVRKNSFVRFLEETLVWKKHFDFVWLLGGIYKIFLSVLFL